MAVLLAALCVSCSSGCYYGHLAAGQSRLLMARRPIDALLADPETPHDLREQLARINALRDYASTLGLSVGEKYTSYAPWPGDRIVTNVVATPPGEIEAIDNCFPVVGCVPYRGYFDEESASKRAASLEKRGLDVCLVGVTAYSTLGWLDDPITDPMLQRGEVELTETVLHELVHATVFLKSEPDFNEGVANFIGQEAAVQFLEAVHPEAAASAAPPPRDRMLDNRALAETLLSAKRAVERLYAQVLTDGERERERGALEDEARRSIAALPQRTRTPEQMHAYAERARLNDACLALRGTYSQDAGRYSDLLDALGGDLQAFVTRLKRAAESDDPVTLFFDSSTPL